MGITAVTGDILLTRAQVIGLGYNARADHEESPLHTQIAYAYPAAFAAFRKQARAGRIAAGEWWLWREAAPWLGLLTIRDSGSGATRLRHVEAALQQMIQSALEEGFSRMALAGLGEADEWPLARAVLDEWLSAAPLSVVIYENHLPGRRAPEPWDVAPPES